MRSPNILTVPIVNGLTNESHPCQIMADIMTFEEKRGSIKGKKLFGLAMETTFLIVFCTQLKNLIFHLFFRANRIRPIEKFNPKC